MYLVVPPPPHGLRIYKELACMKKEHVDIANKMVFIEDSKTPTGVAEVPLTDLAATAFKINWNWRGQDLGSFPAQIVPMNTSRISEKLGALPFGALV